MYTLICALQNIRCKINKQFMHLFLECRNQVQPCYYCFLVADNLQPAELGPTRLSSHSKRGTKTSDTLPLLISSCLSYLKIKDNFVNFIRFIKCLITKKIEAIIVLWSRLNVNHNILASISFLSRSVYSTWFITVRIRSFPSFLLWSSFRPYIGSFSV